MTNSQLYSLTTGSIINKKGTDLCYTYNGIHTGGMYFFTEIPLEDKDDEELENITITRAELLSGYYRVS